MRSVRHNGARGFRRRASGIRHVGRSDLACKPTDRYVLLLLMPTSTTGARQQRAERTRSLIIDTAARAFAENGFDGVSLNDLILASGMSKGAFYFHFSNKEEVALAAFRAKQQELIARLGADAEPGASASDELRSAMRRRARLISDDPTMHCVVRLGADLSVRSGPGSEYASFQALGVQSIADLIVRGVRSGEFAARLDPLSTARAIFAWIVGIDSLSLLDSGGKDLWERTEEVLALMMPTLAARHPTHPAKKARSAASRNKTPNARNTRAR
jgi:AcrR family transcriptional regulator